MSELFHTLENGLENISETSSATHSGGRWADHSSSIEIDVGFIRTITITFTNDAAIRLAQDVIINARILID